MSHKCRGPSCCRTLGLRSQCQSCNQSNERAAHKRRMNRIFERLPKSSHWRQTAHKHLGDGGLTPTIIAETLEAPTEVEQQTRRNRTPVAFYRYYPKGAREIAHLSNAPEGAWFRVVTENGALYTAFRDSDTERLGGRASCPTPNTKLNRP